MVTEGAYGQLKGRWRILLRKCESRNEEVRRSALACVILHNICIDMGDTISKKLDISIDPATNQRRDRKQLRELIEMRACKSTRESCPGAAKIRDCLADKLWLEKQTGIYHGMGLPLADIHYLCHDVVLTGLFVCLFFCDIGHNKTRNITLSVNEH